MLLSLTYGGGGELITSGTTAVTYSAVVNASSGAVSSLGAIAGKGTFGTVVPGQVRGSCVRCVWTVCVCVCVCV